MKNFIRLILILSSMSLVYASSDDEVNGDLRLNFKQSEIPQAVIFSEAAYYVNEGAQTIKEMTGADKIEIINGETGAGYFSGSSAVGFAQQTTERLNIVFRGTVDLYDNITNSRILRSDFYDLGAVHTGYLTVFNSFMEQLNLISQNAIEAGVEDVMVIGHSMGGALAILAAVMLKTMFQDFKKLRLITFNCPRVGNFRFFESFGEVVGHDNYARFVRGRDSVSSVNVGVLGNKHCGVEVRLPSHWNPLSNHAIASFKDPDVLVEFEKFQKKPYKIDGIRTSAIRRVSSSVNLLSDAGGYTQGLLKMGYYWVKGYTVEYTFDLLKRLIKIRPHLAQSIAF